MAAGPGFARRPAVRVVEEDRAATSKSARQESGNPSLALRAPTARDDFFLVGEVRQGGLRLPAAPRYWMVFSGISERNLSTICRCCGSVSDD